MIDGVAVFGGSFNPPGVHHRQVVLELLCHFPRVLVVPCGLRQDKATNNHIDPLHRAAMADLTFGDLPGVEVLHFDLEHDRFTPTVEIDRLLRHEGNLWHVVGSDLVIGGGSGQAQIQQWVEGHDIWRQLHFVVLERDGYVTPPTDLPPNHVCLPGTLGASQDIRRRLHEAQPVTGLVTDHVRRYLDRHHPYHGAAGHHQPSYRLETPSIIIVADEYSEKAQATRRMLEEHFDASGQAAELVVVLGGDGTMLRAIRQHWRRRLPFLGVNHGTIGFLLNDYPQGFTAEDLRQTWITRMGPLLYVESTTSDGQVRQDLAFNDAYLVAAPGHAGWIEVSLNGQVVIPKLVSDGALVSTAAGSSSYARAMGATPIAIGTPSLVLAGSNVFQPTNWKSAQLHLDTEVSLRNVDPTPDQSKRPLYGFSDGQEHGQVREMRIRASRVAAVELAFLPNFDPRQKLVRMQFPTT